MVVSTYFIFMNFTEEAVKNLPDSPDRVSKNKEIMAEMGVTLKEVFALMGGVYDALYMVEAPNCSAATKAALKISSLGYVRTTTNRAFSLEEWKELTSL